MDHGNLGQGNGSKPKKMCMKNLEVNDVQYFEFDLKKVSLRVENKARELILVKVESVTRMLKQQQKLCDQIYQEAIEANYSHEQMTPLNSILGNSRILLEDYHQLVAQYQD